MLQTRTVNAHFRHEFNVRGDLSEVLETRLKPSTAFLMKGGAGGGGGWREAQNATACWSAAENIVRYIQYMQKIYFVFCLRVEAHLFQPLAVFVGCWSSI